MFENNRQHNFYVIMNGVNFIKAYIFLSFFSINILYAQDGSLDQSFNPNDAGFGAGNGANGQIHTISLQANGKIVFAGQFKRSAVFQT